MLQNPAELQILRLQWPKLQRSQPAISSRPPLYSLGFLTSTLERLQSVSQTLQQPSASVDMRYFCLKKYIYMLFFFYLTVFELLRSELTCVSDDFFCKKTRRTLAVGRRKLVGWLVGRLGKSPLARRWMVTFPAATTTDCLAGKR